MNRKRIIISIVVLAALGVLVYMQFRQWRHFDWDVFWDQTEDTRKLYLLSAVGLIYVTYLLRALRWKVFLRPVCQARARSLISPTIIGFAGLALLGRPGEFARPYLIARRQRLSISSQIAVWAVERIFDIGSFAVLMSIEIFNMDLSEYPLLNAYRHDFHVFHAFTIQATGRILVDFAGIILVILVLLLAGSAYVVRRNANGVARWTHRRFAATAPKLAHFAEEKVFAFSEGLNTIHDLGSFAQLCALSLLIWLLIALTYRQVMHAYGSPLDELTVWNVLLIIGLSMIGSVVQLPAIGGGMQIATIGGINYLFDVPRETALSCGIMLWLISFMMVIPTGLILAHREHVSLTKLSRESTPERVAEIEGSPGN